jgi:hypothetical protein
VGSHKVNIMLKTKVVKTLFNPYKHLHSKVKMLLVAEARMSEDERRACQWTVLVKFCDTYFLVGKGDVNTIFIQAGEKGVRQVVYPDSALERLAALGTQTYWRYELRFKDGGTSKWYWSVDRLKQKHPAATGQRIYGHKTGKEKLLYKASTTLQGLDWVEV